jgi:hypothetical protein
VAACGDETGVALEAPEVALEVLELDVDEQAAITSPRPIMAVRILARRRGVTVLPSPEDPAFRVS